MEVACPNGSDGGDSRKKRRGNDGGAIVQDGDVCTWTGECKDLHKHEEECEFKMVKCTIKGCFHECIRKDMSKHLSGDGLLRHLNLMEQAHDKKIAEMQKLFEEQVGDMKKRIESLEHDEIQMRYINDCRAWIKTDALDEFTIYQIRDKKRYQWSNENSPITGLLCYIPGPKGSDWEDARIPMTLRYRSYRMQKPPHCKVPGGFFHVHAYPSGTIYDPTLSEEEGWRSEMSLPDILATVQQWLSHANFNSPSNTVPYILWARDGVEGYHKRCQEEANLYCNYSGHHPRVNNMIDTTKECLDEQDIISKAQEINALGPNGTA
jgi:ubiquitin-conjugating enzyme E2 I